jgi:phage antirepressor YoqD-like protein
MHSQPTHRNTQPDSSGFAISHNMTRQVMSSREIAELLGSRHDKVKQSIDRLIARGTIVQPPVGDEQEPDSLGRPRSLKVYLIGKRDTYVIVAQLSPEFTARLVDRWQELEAQAEQPRLPTNFAEALQVAADQARENQHLHLVIEQQAPKVAALEQLAGTRGSICITEAAKHLGMGPLKLFNWMSANRWIYRRTSFANWSAFQPRLSAGLLEHKLVRIPNNESEELKTVEQVMVTRRGLVLLAEKIGAPL